MEKLAHCIAVRAFFVCRDIRRLGVRERLWRSRWHRKNKPRGRLADHQRGRRWADGRTFKESERPSMERLI
jgi:hypothetical protein